MDSSAADETDADLEQVIADLVLQLDREQSCVEPAPRRRRTLDWDAKAAAAQTEQVGYQLLPDAAELLKRLTHRERASFRDQWCSRLLRSLYPDLRQETGSHKEAVKYLRRKFPLQLSCVIQGWYCHMLDPALPCPPLPSREALAVERPLVPLTPAREEPDAGGMGVLRPHEWQLHGFLLAYNGSWGVANADSQRLQHLEGPEPVLVASVQACSFYQQLWSDFVSLIRSVARALGWAQVSCTMELSLKREKVANLVHFHVAVSLPEKRLRFGRVEAWLFRGSLPHVRGSRGRGRHLQKALDASHYYVQAPRLGTVYTWTNHAKFKDFTVDSQSIMSLWRLYKLTPDRAKSELLQARVKGLRQCIAEIEFVEEEVKKQEAVSLMYTLEASLHHLQRPPRFIQAVAEWMQLFTQEFGFRTGFPFLVLHGPSQFGKTQYAKLLYGADKTLILSRQGISQPNCKDFDRTRHR